MLYVSDLSLQIKRKLNEALKEIRLLKAELGRPEGDGEGFSGGALLQTPRDAPAPLDNLVTPQPQTAAMAVASKGKSALPKAKSRKDAPPAPARAKSSKSKSLDSEVTPQPQAKSLDSQVTPQPQAKTLDSQVTPALSLDAQVAAATAGPSTGSGEISPAGAEGAEEDSAEEVVLQMQQM